jgi:hypothetical protein
MSKRLGFCRALFFVGLANVTRLTMTDVPGFYTVDIPLPHWRDLSMNEFATVIKAPEYPPQLKHKIIFETFDALRDGEAMLLVNDHDVFRVCIGKIG